MATIAMSRDLVRSGFMSSFLLILGKIHFK
jgi:hypothetical protein